VFKFGTDATLRNSQQNHLVANGLYIIMNILIISLSSAIERRNFQQIQMEKLKLDFEFLEATSIHDIDEIMSASSFGVYLDNSASSSKINAGSLL
jgi:GR25 family glycosyltransferase involved in LPS biosynthesis